MSSFQSVLKWLIFCLQSVLMYCFFSLCAVAVHHHHPGGKSADHRSVSGLSFPGGQHLLAAVVSSQPAGCLAAPGRPLPDLLWHVRLHGPGLCRWAWWWFMQLSSAECKTHQTTILWGQLYMKYGLLCLHMELFAIFGSVLLFGVIYL